LVTYCIGTAFWNTLLKERIEVKGRRGRRGKQLLGDLEEMREYWKLKEKAIVRKLGRTHFRRALGLVVRQNAG
jgi:hypothetical protein